MYYSGIKFNDIANGPGIRVTLFVSGCEHHCKGCHNPNTWDFNAGLRFNNDTVDMILKEILKDHVTGLTISGGDPLHPDNINNIDQLIIKIKSFSNKSIWIWTGYTYEKLLDMDNTNSIYHKHLTNILNLIDVLVDGPYIEEKRDITLKFRGSSNQRLIDVKSTLKNGNIVLYE